MTAADLLAALDAGPGPFAETEHLAEALGIKAEVVRNGPALQRAWDLRATAERVIAAAEAAGRPLVNAAALMKMANAAVERARRSGKHRAAVGARTRRREHRRRHHHTEALAEALGYPEHEWNRRT